MPFDSPQILNVVSWYCNVISEIVPLACIRAGVVPSLSFRDHFSYVGVPSDIAEGFLGIAF